jgi:4-amino-4-deoxy-L-arabinose transferase-like glycosyltransferase
MIPSLARRASLFGPRSSLCFFLCVLCVSVVSFFLFFYRLADRDLWSSHEARAGMDAQAVLDGGGYPRLYDGRAEVQKPPLYYWLVAGCARARGAAVDARAVRLPSALSALGCVGVVALLGWGARRPWAGLLAGLVLATSLHFTWLARIGRIDMPLTLTTAVAAAAGYRAQSAARRGGWLLLAYLAVAAGVLFKGPIGLVLPGAALAGHLLVEGRWPAAWEGKAWRGLAGRLGLWWGAPLVLAVTVPVFAWAERASGGQFLREFLWHHNVERGLGESPRWDHPWWLYGPFFLLYFLPWTPLFVVAGVWGWRGGAWKGDPLARFGLAWFASVLLVLSCARFKRADYLLPAYPGAALFLGCTLARWARAGAWGARAVPAGVLLVVAGVVAGWWRQVAWVLPAHEAFRDYRAFAAEVRRHAPAPAGVVFFRTEAHALAFRVGRPLAVLVEWRDLQQRLLAPGPHYLVVPARCVAECRRHLRGVRLEEVLRNTDLSGGAHERPLVLLRSTKDEVQRTK